MFKIIFSILCFCSLSGTAQQLQLKGGLSGFLRERIIYPGYAKHHCIQGTVKIAFKVNLEGNVRQVSLEQGVGADLDEEALRLIKLTNGRWMVPPGYDSTAVVVVPVKFELNGYGCEKVSKATIALALRSYTNQEELLNVVTNFYRAKENGNFNPADETRIIRIKDELQIDDAYLDEIISLGLKKIKQGDKEGGCKEFTFVKYMGSDKANEYLSQHCK